MSNVDRRKYCQLSSTDGAPVHLTQRRIFVELSWKHAAAIEVRGEIFFIKVQSLRWMCPEFKMDVSFLELPELP